MSNPTGKGGFGERKQHINRKGRPRQFDALRNLTLDMFTRPAIDGSGNPVLIEGRQATVIEVVMWRKIHSKNSREVQEAIEIAYGKVPDEIDLRGENGGPLLIKVVYDDKRDNRSHS